MYDKHIEMSKNNDTQQKIYWIFLVIKNYYKLIGIDLSRQTNANIPQQTYLTIKLAEDDG